MFRTTSPMLLIIPNVKYLFKAQTGIFLKNITSRSLLPLPATSHQSCLKYSNVKLDQSDKSEDEKNSEFLKVVYKGSLNQQIRLLKIFSLGTSAIGFLAQTQIYQELNHANVGLILTFGTVVGFFTFVTPLLIHSVAKKYVSKLEYDAKNKKYIATTTTLFLQEKKTPFKVEDVTLPEMPKMFTSFFAQKRALFVDPAQFKDMSHYSRIMGYDKPIDLSFKDDKKDQK